MSATVESPSTPTTRDFPSNPNGTPPSGTPTDSAPGKRLLFGRRKKSSANLNGSTTTLASSQGSIQGNDSLESLNDSANESALKKGVKNVFKRRPRGTENPNASASMGSLDEIPDEGGATTDKTLYEDETGSLGSDESSESPTTQRDSGDRYLSSTATPPSNRIGRPKLFARRSTSPMASLAHSNATFGPAAVKAAAKENTKSPAEGRPSTAGGETRPINDRGRRSGGGRLSVSTSNASDIPLIVASTVRPGAPVPGTAGSYDVSKLSPGNGRMAPGSPDTPSTVLTPPTPTDGAAHFSATNSSQSTNGPGAQAPAGRGRSNSLSNAPSKLLGMTSTDGLPTPPSDPPNSATGGGFFSTMFSAAHNAASGLASNLPINLANVPGNRERATTVDLADITGKRTSGDQAGSTVSLAEGPKREPAVKTLGQGELNLATLGIVPDPHTTPMDGTQAPPVRSRDDGALGSSNRNLPLQFVPATYNGLEIVGESPTLRRTNTPHADDIRSYSRAASSVGDVTPDRHSLIESIDEEDEYDGDGRKRTSSVKSGTATNFPKRNRGSSAASNNPMPTSTQPGMRAGFAVANKKRNKEFHNLFKSVPEDDHLIEDYGCALQKEILLQGRMYVTDGHICFYSNILGWVTNLVIAFDEVMSIEKKSTALLFPNAIVIQTLHARHTFASFISRDATYELMVGLWNVGNPEVQTTPNEAHLDGASPMGESGDGDGEDDDEYEDEDSDDGDSFADAGEPVTERTAPPAGAASKNPSRKPSAQPLNNVSAAGGASADNGGSSAGAAGAADAGPDFPGPKTHGATSCGDDDKHYDKQLCDEVLQAPLGRVYSVLFGPASYPFISQLLSEEEKVLDLQIPNNGEWSEVDGKKQRTLNYVKPLPGGIGPSKTKCIVTEVIDHNDLESHVSVGVTTQTPDVPSGGVFSVKTRYCLMWAEGNATRLIATCTVEWTGKSWIKGPIEKGASDGQIAYNKVLLNALRRELAPKGKSGGGAGAAGGKGRKGKKGKKAANSNTESKASTPAAAAVDDSWGILEPLKPIFSPIVDIFKPLLPANFGTILITVLITWFVSGFLRPQQSAVGTIKEPPRHRWESMWVHEEEGLWEWLEDRAGLEAVPSLRSQRAAKANLNLQKKTSQQIKDRQVEEAIEVMKERLGSLERIYGEGRKLKVEEEIYVQEAPKESAAVMPDVEVEETQKDTQKEQVVAEKEL